MLNEDYVEILQSLLNNKVKFMIVGAYAMGAYGYPRATGDFDIWVHLLKIQKRYINLLQNLAHPFLKLQKIPLQKKGLYSKSA